MHSQQPMIHQTQPAVPHQNGRPGHTGNYSPAPPYPHYSQSYQGYQYSYPVHYQRPMQQWSPYPMPVSMGRGYQQYVPMTPYSMPQNYLPVRPSPQPTPSSSIHSSQAILSPSPSDVSMHMPPTPGSLPLPPSNPNPQASPPLLPPAPPPVPLAVADPAPVLSPSISFYPPLPWQNFTGSFPPRKPRRRKLRKPHPSESAVQLPSRHESREETLMNVTNSRPRSPVEERRPTSSTTEVSPKPLDTTPTSSIQQRPILSTIPPPSTVPSTISSARQNAPAVPYIPAIPNMSRSSRPIEKTSTSLASDAVKVSSPSDAGQRGLADGGLQTNAPSTTAAVTEPGEIVLPSEKAIPKSWADLVKIMGQPASSRTMPLNGHSKVQPNGNYSHKTASLAEALSSYDTEHHNGNTKLSFLEPRGLVNTGNMCYMNSILQILLFCVPFYTFLEDVAKHAAHSFKSTTPLMDSMILFLQEFAVIDAAVSVDQLRMRLKDNELEQYGEAFIPDFVYDVIRRVPRFSSMRRGHQQDAEEFLGFLLEEMHDECSRAIRLADMENNSGMSTPTNGVTSSTTESAESPALDDGGWLEVGPRQKSAITRSSGAIVTESPITKIFGGKLRSELRVPGVKTSVTLEPYQPLQLDIGAPDVSNIIDALKGLTRPETLHGDFNSPRGPGSTATKQVTIETLPRVLILHLKRFQYDNSGGTQKIWKKVGYPLELEMPKEVFPQHKRGGLLVHGGLPKYRLIGVVYHHGKNAGGGHYTVDVRRQEGREWIRLDDTVIRRIRQEDVAEGGSEEDPKVLAAAVEQHKISNSMSQSRNVYQSFAADMTAERNEEGPTNSEKAWNQVNGVASSARTANKKVSDTMVKGAGTATNSTGELNLSARAQSRDNKVAYILFYQKFEQ